jgi:hypothetical protein
VTSAPEVSRVVSPNGTVSATFADGTVQGFDPAIAPPAPPGSIIILGPAPPTPQFASPEATIQETASAQAEFLGLQIPFTFNGTPFIAMPDGSIILGPR